MITEEAVIPARGAMWGRARSLWTRLASLGQRAPRRLRVSETVPLGERRFVAIVEFEKARFLVGGTSSSLVLLASLGSADGPEAKREEATRVAGGQA
ncbi:MAG: flagellar biosynthetic protein FliO [Acidobacteriia bacterium]|nr:flagellar biosynthetic protein FliO [Terriglobia bacterium]